MEGVMEELKEEGSGEQGMDVGWEGGKNGGEK